MKRKLKLSMEYPIIGYQGREYLVTKTGAQKRLTPRPWRGKSERRQVIKQRRLELA